MTLYLHTNLPDWPAMGIPVDYLTSDQHFGHKNISVYANRPFDNSISTQEMDAALINAWNDVVGENDHVIHLGDLAMGQRHLTVPIVCELNGVVSLVPGNHDKVSSLFSIAQQEASHELYATYTNLLPETGLWVTTSLGNRADVSHYPFAESGGESHHPDSPAMRKLRVKDTGTNLLVHGHTHLKSAINGRMFHVGVDAHDLTPVAARDVEEWIDSMS